MRAPRAAPPPADRLGPGDLMELASDVGPVPLNVGALLVLDAPVLDAPAVDAPAVDPHALGEAVVSRAGQVRRLGQRLTRPRTPGRRPHWEPAPADLRRQVAVQPCPAPGDREALQAHAVRLLQQPLPRDAPLWRATVVTHLADGRLALVLVLHHVLADGIGGLAVLAALADDPPRVPPPARSPARPPAAPAEPRSSLRSASRELGGARPHAAPATSLNRPTGPHRAIVTAGVDLAPLRAAAHASGATVNDLLLVAVTGAAAQVLAGRGELPSALVVSVPVSARSGTTAGELGNRVGVMPVRVPLGEGRVQRLAAVAAATSRQRGAGHRGTSAALVGPAFRVLAATGLLRAAVNHQRLVNLFLTNLRGPATPLSIAGATVVEAVPLSGTQGNVGLAFAALSYAGRLTVTALIDPDVLPERRVLREALQHELDALLAPGPA